MTQGYSRRQIIKTLLALGAGSVSLSCFQALADRPGAIVLPDTDAKTATVEVFEALSRLVTLRDRLDPETVQKMYKIFMDEPWAPDHIVRVYNKTRAALGKRERASLKDKSWKFDEGESWFVGHLLTTWYLGVYYHEQRPTQRIAYETALMFDPTRGIMPVPFRQALGYDGWAEAPEDEP